MATKAQIKFTYEDYKSLPTWSASATSCSKES
jgi:hypothetical protein